MAHDSKRFWNTALSRQEEWFLFSSLMLVTCFFLPWRSDQTPYEILSEWKSPLEGSMWALLLVVLIATPLTLRYPRVRPWAGLLAAGCISVVILISGFASDYGAQLARVFALVMLVLSANPAVLRTTDFVMKRLNSKKAEVFGHWVTTCDVQFSTQEFYAKVENMVWARAWPGVETLRVLYTEAGLLSSKREYLRILRQRQVFDLCASTFGKDYFFSVREAEIQVPFSLSSFLIVLFLLLMVFLWLVGSLGFIFGTASFLVALVLGFFILFNTLRLGLTRLDGFLLLVPAIGPVYEAYFRRSTTYFQHDTHMVFLKLVGDLVKEMVDEEANAQGIKLLSCFEHQPLFDGFYRLSQRPTDESPQPPEDK